MIVYKCTNLINDKIYIGKTYNFKKRKQQHCWDLNKYISYFHNAISKYGKENFQWNILNEVKTNKEANELEIFWINYFKSNNFKYGYNMTIGGEGFTGYKWTEEMRKKRSGINHHLYNKHHTKEARNKIKKARKNQIIKHSKETKKKISNSNRDKIILKECREKISKTKTGKKIIGEALENIRKANKILSQKRIIKLKGIILNNLILDYLKGYSIYSLVDKYNISFRVIKRNLLENNIILRNHSEQSKIMNNRRKNENRNPMFKY